MAATANAADADVVVSGPVDCRSDQSAKVLYVVCVCVHCLCLGFKNGCYRYYYYYCLCRFGTGRIVECP